jgi:predicted ATPase
MSTVTPGNAAATKYSYRLSSITLNDGTVIAPGQLTVFIGPNNSGKSRLLREISCLTTNKATTPVIVADIDVELPQTLDELRAAYDVERSRGDNGQYTIRTIAPDLASESQHSTQRWPADHEPIFVQRPDCLPRDFAEIFGRSLVAILSTENRLQLVKEGAGQAHHFQAASLLQMLYSAGPSASDKVSDLAKKTFGHAVALDFTVPTKLQLRVGEDFSGISPDPREARKPMLQFERLDDQGDGLRSFIGIAVALLTLERPLVLIDEPEAFLHPPQAYRMGATIAEQVLESRQMLVATHSSDVLQGILGRTQDVTIVRIDRRGNVNSFRQLEAKTLKGIIRDPLLTSARVLNGLFYASAVVVEADSDARFYHAVAERLADGLDVHFVNADNKQTVAKILRLYRDMGVRAAGIVDSDLVRVPKELLATLGTLGADAATLEEIKSAQTVVADQLKQRSAGDRLHAIRDGLNELADRVAYSLEHDNNDGHSKVLKETDNRLSQLAEDTRPWKELKKSGRAALTGNAQEAFDSITSTATRYGLYINPAGELEAMLQEHGIPYTTDKKSWITQALQLIGSMSPDLTKQPWKLMKEVQVAISEDEN